VRHVRMLGLCLVAALALGAYAVSSASALEWGKCENVGSGGNYTGSNCTKAEKAKPKGSGSYEWRKASEVAAKRVAEGKSAGVPFTGHSEGGGGVLTASVRECTIITPEGTVELRVTRQKCAEEGGEENNVEEVAAEVECSNESATGESEGKNKVAHIHVVFTGCSAFGAFPCQAEGSEEGEVPTNELKGKLGWINKANKEVGVLLEPAAKHGLFADFECGGILGNEVGVGNKKEGTFYVQGEKYPEGCYGECPGATPAEEKHGGYDGIISPITPVNQNTSEYTQVYTEESEFPFRNIPMNFEKKHIDVLENGFVAISNGRKDAWASAGEVITNVNVTEEEGEIKA
jgi:hypothetical protein